MNDVSDFAHAAIWSALSTMVPTASESGTTSTRSSPRVITVTARARLFHSRACTQSISCQVATTIMVAQTTAGRNGRKIQNDAAMSAAMNSTASVVRVRSRCKSGMTGSGWWRRKTAQGQETPGTVVFPFKALYELARNNQWTSSSAAEQILAGAPLYINRRQIQEVFDRSLLLLPRLCRDTEACRNADEIGERLHTPVFSIIRSLIVSLICVSLTCSPTRESLPKFRME